MDPIKPSPPAGELRVLPDVESLRRAAADEMLRISLDVLRSRKAFTVALAGGTTPKSLYELLGTDLVYRSKVPWNQVHLFWGDERLVHADHPDSNYAMVRESLLSKVSLTRKQIHRIRTEGGTPAQAAHEYEKELRAFFTDLLMLRHNVPRFDLALLGMGEDGHAAGLFPGWEVVRERRLLVAAPPYKDPKHARITMTPVVFNMAANVIFVVSGKRKAQALKDVLEGPRQPEKMSAQAVKPSDGRLLWLVDREAASLLSPAVTV